jgi:uncharacterized protein YijF (DUF1287 family)
MKCLTIIGMLLCFNTCTPTIDIDQSVEPKRYRFVSCLPELVDRGIIYDPSYRRVDFPCGDVPDNIGVCADVVVRAFLNIDVCLQQEIYNYRKSKGLSTDTNIDHRRVRNLGPYFESKGWEVHINKNELEPGDIIWWKINGLDHVGIVYHNGKMLHNIGRGQSVDIKPDHYHIYRVFRINA